MRWYFCQARLLYVLKPKEIKGNNVLSYEFTFWVILIENFCKHKVKIPWE